MLLHNEKELREYMAGWKDGYSSYLDNIKVLTKHNDLLYTIVSKYKEDMEKRRGDYKNNPMWQLATKVLGEPVE